MSSPSFPQWLEVEPAGEVTIVRFTQPLVLTGELADTAREHLFRLIEEPGRLHLVLNFGEVKSLTSLMISNLIQLHKKLQAAGGRLALCTANPVLYEIFQVVRLPLLLGIYGDEKEALQSFQSASV